jgi:hypothetical protein
MMGGHGLVVSFLAAGVFVLWLLSCCCCCCCCCCGKRLLHFSGMLDLLAFALDGEGIPFVRIDGSSSAKARRDAMLAFAGEALALPPAV